VVIGDNTVIAEHVSVSRDTVLGADCYIFPRVTIYHGCKIGSRVRLHSGVVIGADGFGYAPQQGGLLWKKIEQLGAVCLGDDVEIGANSTIDRGALDDTVLGDGVIVDNLVQIGHNAVIGDNSALAACSAVAGTSIIGKNCRLAGGVGIAGHLEIVDNVTITGMSMVAKSLHTAGSYSSGTPLQDTKKWRKNAARIAKLDHFVRKTKLDLEKNNNPNEGKK
jgi:UDP-3-O-[3-hydroxymyristoyl] glucosamine N-acyltransferase